MSPCIGNCSSHPPRQPCQMVMQCHASKKKEPCLQMEATLSSERTAYAKQIKEGLSTALANSTFVLDNDTELDFSELESQLSGEHTRCLSQLGDICGRAMQHFPRGF